MAFSKENKVSWEELSPSTQKLFKDIQALIITERSQRIAADAVLLEELASLEEELNTYLDDKYDELKDKVDLVENKIGNIFDSQNRLTFPNGDKFWIG